MKKIFKVIQGEIKEFKEILLEFKEFKESGNPGWKGKWGPSAPIPKQLEPPLQRPVGLPAPRSPDTPGALLRNIFSTS